MIKPFDKPIEIQTIDEMSETWTTKYELHARINKAKANSEYLNAGAIQSKRALTFEIRYFKALEDIALNTQSYRVLFDDTTYNIEDYDDYMLEHKTIKLLGVSY
jgi:SPP1 family predicted phage head-tail adaptor